MATQIAEITTIVQNIVLAACGMATVFIAYLGLTTWRKELKGKSEYTKAKEVLKAVYKVRSSFMHVRNPIMYSFEFPEEMRGPRGNLKEEHDYEGRAHAYAKRWKLLADAFQELEEQNLEAQVEWGPEFQDVIIPLRKCLAELQITIGDMLERKKSLRNHETMSAEEKAKERSVLYYTGEDSKHDEFTQKINAAIKLFEKKLRPHIK